MFIFQILRALIIKRRLRVYKREKYLSYQKYQKKKAQLYLFDKISHFWDDILFCGICKLWLSKFLNQFTTVKKYRNIKKLAMTDGTLESYIFKSALGFTGGIILIYFIFTFLVFEMDFPYTSTMIVCWGTGFFLTLGLAVSANVRCVVLMVLPQLFSERGRQALLAYTFLLTMTGPTKNVLYNTRVLTESLACTQEQLKVATQSIRELAKAPFHAIKAAIIAIVKAFKVIIKKVKEMLITMKRVIDSIVGVIKSAADWLLGGSTMCNKKFGSPFQRCVNSINEAVADCKVSVPPFADEMCSVAYAAVPVCYPVKFVDYFCDFVTYISDDVFNGLKRKINDFSRHLKTMFYVKITFSHSFSFRTNQTKTIHDIASGIINEVKDRTHWFTHLFSWMSFTFMSFVVYLVYHVVLEANDLGVITCWSNEGQTCSIRPNENVTFFGGALQLFNSCGLIDCIFYISDMFLQRVLYYRYRFMSSLSFDNRFLSKHLYDIDFKRTKLGRETVLPLTRAERSKYIELTSIKLLRKERRSLVKATGFLIMTLYKLGVHMLLDVALNWILLLIRRHGRLQVNVDVPNSINVHAKGKGMLADMYRSVANALKPLGLEMHMDTLPCLPDPSPPDYHRYKQIFSLIGLIWALTVLKPYAKRMRNVVMSYYHPDLAKERAVWLYNHILRSRGNFLTYARRRLRRLFGLRDKLPHERITLVQRCFAMFPVLDWLFGQGRGTVCLVCGQPETSNEELIQCPTVGCIGLYCQKCFEDLKNTCTICLRPIDYGDLSDISEEKDSSDDELLHKTNLRAQDNIYFDDEYSHNSDEDGTQTSRTTETSNTRYSYSYQDEEFTKNDNALLVTRPAFEDLEAQKLIKYASNSDLFSALDKTPAYSSSEVPVDTIPVAQGNERDKDIAITVEPEDTKMSKSSPLRASLLKTKLYKTDKSVVIDNYFNKLKEFNSERIFDENEKFVHVSSRGIFFVTPSSESDREDSSTAYTSKTGIFQTDETSSHSLTPSSMSTKPILNDKDPDKEDYNNKETVSLREVKQMVTKGTVTSFPSETETNDTGSNSENEAPATSSLNKTRLSAGQTDMSEFSMVEGVTETKDVATEISGERINKESSEDDDTSNEESGLSASLKPGLNKKALMTQVSTTFS